MTFLSMEDFVGNGALKEVLPKLLQEGWDDVSTLKLMKTGDMDAINMTQQQKDSLEMRSYLHDRSLLLQYGDKLEASGKCLFDLLGLSIDHLSDQFDMKRGHIARFMDGKTSVVATCAVDPLLQTFPQALISNRKTTAESSRINRIYQGMNRKLYRAAMGGEENEDIDRVLRQYNNDQLEQQFTSNKNTVLHVAAQFGNQKCVEKILKNSPSLLRCSNINGETPLHVAARQGYYEIVAALIRSAEKLDQEEELESGGGGVAKEMLRATNKDKDTALHMAVRNPCSWRVVALLRLLIQKDKEFTHLANNSEETPLFLAAERGDIIMVSMILENCTSPPAYGGPGNKTALHAAVMNRSSWETEFITNKILEWKPDLIKETDVYGWTPLHYAARYNNRSRVKCLLENDKSVMYITTDDADENTALHIAAANGNVEVMKELLSQCPDCWEIVNSKGQNVLHVAVDMEQESTIKYMLEKLWIIHLINQKDIEGNTPLHLLEASSYELPKLSWHRSRDREATNNNNMTPEDLRQSRLGLRPTGYKRMIVSRDQHYITKWKGDREERKKVSAAEENRKRADTYLIVATLITAVTFAASFTIPGGYVGNPGPEQGMPVLLRAAAFKAFVTTNTIAVVCSVSSAFLTLSASFYKDENKQDSRYQLALWLILIAMGAMMVALITGTYVVLSHSLAIAITCSVIGCFSFLILIPEVIKLYGILKYRVAFQIDRIMAPFWSSLKNFWSSLKEFCEFCYFFPIFLFCECCSFVRIRVWTLLQIVFKVR